MRRRVTEESTFQRLATTCGTPAATKVRAMLFTSAVVPSLPLAVSQAERTASLRLRSREA